MFEKISFIINKKIKKSPLLKKSLFVYKLSSCLKNKNIKNIDFKVKNKNEIIFYCPDHPTINFLKQNEEFFRSCLNSRKINFRYFLKAN